MKSESVFKSMQQGILICDRLARILYFNEAYAAFIDCKLEDVKGKPINEIRTGAIAKQVIHTGKPVEGLLRKEGEQEYFVNVYPIVEEETIKGSISIVTTMKTAAIQEKTNNKTLQQRVKEYEKQEINKCLAIYGGDLKGKLQTAKELGISLATLYNKIKET